MDIKVAENVETPWLSLGAGSITISFRRVGRVDIAQGPAKMAFPFSPVGVLDGESALGAYSISWNQIATILLRREKAVAK